MEQLIAYITDIDILAQGSVYASIMLLLIVGIVRCTFPVVRTRARLRTAIRSIKADGAQDRSWQDDTFLGKGSLYAHWSEYLNNLFFADGVYHNASNVEDYINEETAIHGPGRASFAEAVPSLMVTLGFLGTLLGLMMGLSGFDMSDSAAVQTSILTLIPAMKYAFTTSIVGVVASVCFTLITRMIAGSTERALKDFYGAMSRHAGVLSVDPMTQIAIYQQEQTALIQTLVKDMNGSFAAKLSGAIEAAVEPLTDSMTRFVKVTTEEQMRFLDRVAGRFVDKMNDALEGQFINMARAMEESAENQARLSQDLRGAMIGAEKSLEDLQQMNRLTDSMFAKFDEYVSKLGGAQKQVDDAYMRVSSNVEQMELVSRQQISYLNSVNSMHSDITRDVSQLCAAVDAFSENFAQKSGESSGALIKAAEELRAAGTELARQRKEFTGQLDKDLTITLASFHDYMTEFTRRVDYMTDGIAGALDRLPESVGDAANQLLNQVDHLSASLNRANRAISDAAERLYGG